MFTNIFWTQDEYKTDGFLLSVSIDDLHTDQYNYKKPKSTDAVFAKSFL